MTMISRRSWVGGMGALALLAGCHPTPPPPRVAVPSTANREAVHESDYLKPLPPRDERMDLRTDQRVRGEDVPPPPASPPPVREGAKPQAPSEGGGQVPDPAKVRADFLDAYKQVGQPKFVVLVNRTLDGKLVADDSGGGAFLKPDQYDAEAAKSVDLAGLEAQFVRAFGFDNKVNLVSPASAREKLTDVQVKDLEAGQEHVLGAIDSSLGADVLIQIAVLPTRQVGKALELRIVGETVNVRGGQVIGHAVADLDHPGDKGQIDAATQYVTQKLLIDMLRAWTAPETPPPSATPAPAPAPTPAPAPADAKP